MKNLKFEIKMEAKLINVSLPLRWFSHFYVFAAVFSTFSLLVTLNVYLGGGTVPAEMVNLLNSLATKQRSYTGQYCCSFVFATFHVQDFKTARSFLLICPHSILHGNPNSYGTDDSTMCPTVL